MKNSTRLAASAKHADCRECKIHRCFLCTGIHEADLGLIAKSVRAMRFEAGSTLFGAGETGDSLFHVRDGLVKLVQSLPDGTQRIVRLLGRGTVAGLEVLLDRPYEHIAMTLHSTLVCRIPSSIVYRLDDAYAGLHWQLISQWQDSLHEADEWITELSTGNTRGRLARLLLFLINGSGCECRVFNREDMGAILGVTTETASRAMAEFKREGLITENGTHRCRCSVDTLRDIAFATSPWNDSGSRKASGR